MSAERIFATPLAKRIAEQNQIDLKSVTGTGPNGRIIKEDIESFLAKPNAGATSFQPANFDAPDLSACPFHEEKHSNMRKVVAKRLTEAKQTIPHFYLNIDCQLDALLALRKQINERLTDGKISVNDMVIKASALALRDNPNVNASWGESAMIIYDRVDISIAVAVEGGLVTPIIRAADQKPLAHISQEMKALAEKARDGKLMPEEYQGGGFSISNLGMFGIKDFSAVINPPQSCILAVGAGVQQPIVKDGELSVGTVMGCTLSVDHRAVDGALGAEFLKSFKSYIEDPLGLLL